MYFARGRSTVIGGGTGNLKIKAFENNFPTVSDVIVKKNGENTSIYPTEIHKYVIKVREPNSQSKLIPIESGIGRLVSDGEFERIQLDNTYKDGVFVDVNPLPLDITVNSVIEIIGFNESETILSREVTSDLDTLVNDKILTNNTENLIIATLKKDTAVEGLVFQQLNTGACQVNSGVDVTFIDLSSGEIVPTIVTTRRGQQVLIIKTAIPNYFIVSNSTFTPVNQALYTNTQAEDSVGVLAVTSDGLGLYPTGETVEIGFETKPINTPVGFPWINNNLNLKRKKHGKIVADFNISKFIPPYTNIWYVDPINGNDGTAVVNNRNLPLLNISTALAKVETSAFAVVIINLVSDYIGRGVKSFNGVQPTKSVAVFVESTQGYRYISAKTSAAVAPTWTLTPGFTKTYETVITAVNSDTVVDFSLKTLPSYTSNDNLSVTISSAPSRYRKLTKVTSAAEVEATPGTWYNDGTKTYVRPLDDRNLVGSNTMQPLSAGDNLKFPNSQDNTTIYVQGVDFVGGNPIKSAPILVTASGGASGGNVVNTTNTTGLVSGMEVTGTGITNTGTINTVTNNVSFSLVTGTLSAAASGTYIAYFKNNTLVLDSCTVQMSNTTTHGLGAQLPGYVYMYNTWCYNNGKDGFNYHSPQSDGGVILGSSPYFVEIFCGGKGNGSTGSAGPSDNATCAHDRSVGITFGCVYIDSADRVCIDNDYVKRWVLDTVIGQATRIAADKESIAAVGLLGQMTWLDSVVALNGSNPKWVAKDTSGAKATLYHYNSGTVVNSSGNTGNIVPYNG